MALALLLALAALIAYRPVLRNGFVNLDDPAYVTANPRVQAGLTRAGVSWALTAVVASNWHPLTLWSHMLDCQLFGLDPRGHHGTSLLLHAACVVALFEALRRMTGAMLRSAAAAALFAVHPTHVESVAWVAERKDLLCALFWLLALCAWTGYARRPRAAAGRRISSYLLAAAAFALALLAKPMAVSLPFVLLLLDFWPFAAVSAFSAAGAFSTPGAHRRPGAQGRRRAEPAGPPGSGGAANDLRPPRTAAQSAGSLSGRQAAKYPWHLLTEKLPFFALAGAAAIVTLGVQAGARATAGAAPVGLRLANALVSSTWYLRETLWPGPLAVYYPFPSSVPPAAAAGCGLLVAALTACAVAARRRAPFLLTGWLWFLVTLGPVIGLVQVGGQARADRYAYLPSIGLLVALVWGLAEIVKALTERVRNLVAEARAEASDRILREPSPPGIVPGSTSSSGPHGESLVASGSDTLVPPAEPTRQARPEVPGAVGAVGALIAGAALLFGLWLVILARETRQQIATWTDGVTLLRHDLAVAGDSYLAHLNLAEALREEIPATPPLAGQLQPDELQREALVHYQAAAALGAGAEERAAAEAAMGSALRTWGRAQEALPVLRASLALAPRDPRTHETLGMALADRGDRAGAMAELRRALALDPGSARAHHGLAVLAAQQGDAQAVEEAIRHFRLALAADPTLSEIYPALGGLLAARGRLGEAADLFAGQVRREPRSPEAHYNLAITLARLGRLAAARQELQRASRLAPGRPEIRRALAALGPP